MAHTESTDRRCWTELRPTGTCVCFYVAGDRQMMPIVKQTAAKSLTTMQVDKGFSFAACRHVTVKATMSV